MVVCGAQDTECETRATHLDTLSARNPEFSRNGCIVPPQLYVGRFNAYRFVSSFLRLRSMRSVRILVTVKPQMYRETLALALHEHRPGDEVMLAPSEMFDGEVKDFGPHLLVRNDNDGAAPEALETVACRIDVLLSDGMGARINLDGRVWKIEDMSVDDLLAVVDEAGELTSIEPAG
jgi:hypothetical protein